MQRTNADQSIVGEAVAYKRLGGYDVIEVIERNVRPPSAGEVRITVTAAGVNLNDIQFRDPGFEGMSFPFVPGMEASGVIESVGPDVSHLRVGDTVMAVLMPRRVEGGAQARHVIAPSASVVPIPDGVSLLEAATLPMNGLTALRALELMGLREGQWLAISGGAGNLAGYAIAAAKSNGVKVIADAKTQHAAEVRQRGADIVVERSDKFADVIRQSVPDGVDALLDTALLGERAFPALRDEGVYVPVRGWGNQPGRILVKPVFVFQVLGRTDLLDRLRGLVSAKAIRLVTPVAYAPHEAAQAQQMLVTDGFRGRIAIHFNER